MFTVEGESSKLDRSDIRTIHFDGLLIEVYRDIAFRENKEALTKIEAKLYSDIFLRSPEESLGIVTRNMEHDDVTSILARRGNEYIAFATGNRFAVSIGEGEAEAKINIGYLSDRAIMKDYRRKGLGRFFYELFALLYSSERDPIDMFFHRSGSAAAIRSAIRSEVFRYGYHPFGDGQKLNPYSSNPLVQDAAYALYPVIKRYSVAYYPGVGLSLGEYREPGKDFRMVYVPDPEHEPTMTILRMMKSCGAKLERGDAFIAGGPARPVETIIQANPQLLRNPLYQSLKQAA